MGSLATPPAPSVVKAGKFTFPFSLAWKRPLEKTTLSTPVTCVCSLSVLASGNIPRRWWAARQAVTFQSHSAWYSPFVLQGQGGFGGPGV